VLRVSDVVALEQLAERQFFHQLPSPFDSNETLTVVGSGVHFNGAPLRAPSGPPLLGEHNDELLNRSGVT